MSANAKTLESEVMKLSREERADLADKLWLSVDDQIAVDAAWSLEIERRLREVAEGTADIVSHTDVVAEMRARYSK